MSARGIALVAAAILVGGAAGRAHADNVSDSVHELSRRGVDYKVRLSAALALAKSKDPRAIIALADALTHDDDATIRRVAALALEKMIDSSTPADANGLAFSALDRAAQGDDDPKVRDTAAKTARVLAGFRRHGGAPVAPPSAPGGGGGGRGPEIFVQIDTLTDQSKKLTGDVGERVVRIVRRGVEHQGYATQWPGGQTPSQAELTSAHSHAFIVAATVKKIEFQKMSSQTQVACTVAMRISPWGGRDGGERWEAAKAANATGSAKAMTGSGDRDIVNGIRDCLETITEDITARQVLPFLKRLATPGS
jgi:hypothetical protein